MVVGSILAQVKFGLNDRREDALYILGTILHNNPYMVSYLYAFLSSE